MEEEITIEISPTGDTTVSVKGVKGTSCRDLTKNIEKALGTVTSDKPTPEMREVATDVNRNRAGR
jgi:hypothetical protein